MQHEIEKLLLEQLRDAYSAEKQALRCMQRSARWVASLQLKAAIEAHVEETKGQIGRLDDIFEAMNAKPGRKLCLAMKGLVEEAVAGKGEDGRGPILDLLIAASMQRIEHYEISAYGTLILMADALEIGPVVKALQQTLAEEQQTEVSLTQMVTGELMPSAIKGEGAVEGVIQKRPPGAAPAKRPRSKSAAGGSASAEPTSEKPASRNPGSQIGIARRTVRPGR